MSRSIDDLRLAEGRSVRQLVLLLGDQLDPRWPQGLELETAFDRQHDAVVMIEARGESTHVPSHRQRSVLFLSAMRHRALELAADGIAVDYRPLDAEDGHDELGQALAATCRRLRPQRLVTVRAGDWRLVDAVRESAERVGVELETAENPHFLVTPDEFSQWAADRKRLVMEHFYRWMRRRLDLLIEDGQPAGGRWNYDADNRDAFGDDAPPIPSPRRFPPDAITRQVMELVERELPDAPGELDSFAWPVTADDARAALDDFVAHRLPCFGQYQDAMASGEPWLFHSLLSPALNLALLDPRQVVRAALDAWQRDDAPLASVEGFVRQIVGWREFIRGVYWLEGRDYGDRNHLEQTGDLPAFYWSGETDMACLSDAIGQVLRHGYGHHIQRLMVTGNFALTAGVHPRQVSDWYLAMYVDAVDWVTLPNTAGMVMFADGGVVGTKPYAATGAYIDRMSDHCGGCRFDPKLRSGDDACPLTTFYWDFLDRNRERLDDVARMGFAWRNLERLEASEREAIRRHASKLRQGFAIEPAEGGTT